MIAAILESGELERVCTGLSLLVSAAADGAPGARAGHLRRARRCCSTTSSRRARWSRRRRRTSPTRAARRSRARSPSCATPRPRCDGVRIWACAAAVEATGADRAAVEARLDGVMSTPRFLREVARARSSSSYEAARRRRRARALALGGLRHAVARPVRGQAQRATDRNANVDVVVNDGGSVTCNGKEPPARRRPACCAPARSCATSSRRPSCTSSCRPARAAQLRYRARMEAGDGRRSRTPRAATRQPFLALAAFTKDVTEDVCGLRAGSVGAMEELFDAIKAGDAERGARARRGRPALASARDEDGLSAVLTALYHRQAEALDALLAAEPELDVLEAAALGRLDVLRAHLEADPDALAARSPEGFTPLHLAAFFGGAAAVRLLLAAGRARRRRRRQPRRVRPLHSAAAAARPRRRARRCSRRAPTPTCASRAATRRCSPPPTRDDAEMARAAARATAPTRALAADDGRDPAAMAGPRVAALLRGLAATKWTLPFERARACARSTKSSRLIAARNRRVTSFSRAVSERRSSRPCLASSPNSTVAAIW